MSWLGATRVDLDSCGSTNDEAERLARDGAPHGAIVIARCQSAGRGRGAHAWYSPAADNLYLSCVLRPSLAVAHVPPITLAAGVAVCDAVNSFGVRASLKWPNDVLVFDRKLAGILAEMSTRGGQLEHVVLGIGVNVNSVAFPPELAHTATSLRTALGDRPVDVGYVTRVLLASLERWLDRFLTGGVEAISRAWTERALLSGRLEVRRGDDRLVGRPRGIAADGGLLLEDQSGAVHHIIAGEVLVATARSGR